MRDAKVRHANNFFAESSNSKELWNNLKKLTVRPSKNNAVSSGSSADDLDKFCTQTPIFDEEAIQANIEACNAFDSLVGDTFYFKNVSFDDQLEAELSVKRAHQRKNRGFEKKKLYLT